MPPFVLGVAFADNLLAQADLASLVAYAGRGSADLFASRKSNIVAQRSPLSLIHI